MKILITGSTGFIGRNLKEYFQERYDDLHCPKRLDLNLLDAQAVYDYIIPKHFDVVIHCAVTLASVEQNLKMYFNVERCASSFGKMICLGSGAEYDMRYYVPKMKEEYFGAHVPAEIYGFSKYVIAKDIESRHRNLFNLRGFGIYGKYEDYTHRFISNNICRVLSGCDISIRRNMVFDYVYVKDLARIVEMFVQKAPAERSYNICNRNPLDLLTYAKIIQKVDGRDVPIVIKAEGNNPEYSGDNTRFTREFGEFSFTPAEEAVKELYQWYKESSGIAFDPALFA